MALICSVLCGARVGGAIVFAALRSDMNEPVRTIESEDWLEKDGVRFVKSLSLYSLGKIGAGIEKEEIS